jgi:hypothetical protein
VLSSFVQPLLCCQLTQDLLSVHFVIGFGFSSILPTMAYNNNNSSNSNAYPSSSHPSPTIPSPHAMFNNAPYMSPRETQEEENRRVSSTNSTFFPTPLDPMPPYSTQPLQQQYNRESEIPFPPLDQQQQQQHQAQQQQQQQQEREYNVHRVGNAADSTSRPRATGSVRAQPYNVARRPQSSLGRLSGRTRPDLTLPERSISYPSR